jgi:glycine hydroxymethyltransferase
MTAFFDRRLLTDDTLIADAVRDEMIRQQNQIELIASENIASPAVMAAQGTVFTNKYAEGYPGHRYYGGCEYADVVEAAAISRAKALFGANFANVQAHSGAQANGAVLLALLKPGDTLLGMSLDAGGHLTHGARPTLSGKWFNAVQYGVRHEDNLIDFEQVEQIAYERRPKLIVAGGSAYPRVIDFARFRRIADEIGAYLMVDMAHFAGLVAGGVHPNPIEHAHVVTSTTHKTLRGPRGGIIFTNDEVIAKKINSAIFPGLQGGPLMHVVAAKAVALGEAQLPAFKSYARRVVANAKVLARVLGERGFGLVSGGTDTHVILVDLRSKKLTGKAAEQSLERAHLTCNKNGIPFDPQPPAVTSGIRLGTPAGTTRGFGEAEFEHIGRLIADVLDDLAIANMRDGLTAHPGDNSRVEDHVRSEVLELCRRFPIYNGSTVVGA